MADKEDATDGLTLRENFRHMRRDILRFADLDRNGHLNNVKFFEFCQESRVALFRAAGAHDGENGRAWLIVKLAIDFRAPAHWPGEMQTGTRVLRIGNSSIELGQGLFNDGSCVATATMTMVRSDLETSRPAAIEPALRHRLLELAGDQQS